MISHAPFLQPKSKPRYHLDIDSFLNIPANVYWKDIHGIHLGCNDHTAIDTGLRSCADYRGLTIYDISENNSASIVDKADRAIIASRRANFILESSGALYSLESTYLSMKTPLFNPDGKVVGLFGISLRMNNALSNQNLDLLKAFGNINNLACTLLVNKRIENRDLLSLLTQRETEILFLLVQGNSAKSIARKLFLSIRTAENHINHIRRKWGCQKTTQLISLALGLGIEDC